MDGDSHKHTFKADIQKQAESSGWKMQDEETQSKNMHKTTHMKGKENK